MCIGGGGCYGPRVQRKQLFTTVVGALALSLACSGSSGGPDSASPGSSGKEQDGGASSGLVMPAAGEYVALSDARYGHLKAASSAPSQGDAAPDFELPTHSGETFVLSEALAQGPVLLMFYRGFW